MDHFWNRWRREYIPTIRELLKLNSTGETMQIGDDVSIHDESLPRAKWRMGVVHELIKGVKKKMRGAVVCIADKGKISFLRRPLQRLFPLEILGEVVEESESQPEELESERNLESVKAQPDEMPSRPTRQGAQAGEERRRLLTNAYSPIGRVYWIKDKVA